MGFNSKAWRSRPILSPNHPNRNWLLLLLARKYSRSLGLLALRHLNAYTLVYMVPDKKKGKPIQADYGRRNNANTSFMARFFWRYLWLLVLFRQSGSNHPQLYPVGLLLTASNSYAATTVTAQGYGLEKSLPICSNCLPGRIIPPMARTIYTFKMDFLIFLPYICGFISYLP